MEKSNGTKIAVGIVVFSLFIYSIYFNQIAHVQELELKSVGKDTPLLVMAAKRSMV